MWLLASWLESCARSSTAALGSQFSYACMKARTVAFLLAPLLPYCVHAQCLTGHMNEVRDVATHRDRAAAVFVGYPVRQDTVTRTGGRYRMRVWYVVSQAWKLPAGPSRERPIITIEHEEAPQTGAIDHECPPAILFGEWMIIFAHPDADRLRLDSAADVFLVRRDSRIYRYMMATLGTPTALLPPVPSVP